MIKRVRTVVAPAIIGHLYVDLPLPAGYREVWGGYCDEPCLFDLDLFELVIDGPFPDEIPDGSRIDIIYSVDGASAPHPVRVQWRYESFTSAPMTL